MQIHSHRYYSVFIYILVTLFLLLNSAMAEEKQQKKARNISSNCLSKTWWGNWQGTIGNIPITISFNSVYIDGSEVTAGKYYYRSSLTDMILKQDKTNPIKWQEFDPKGKLTGKLTLTCKDNAFSGEWESANGKQKLPINAQAIESYTKSRHEALKLKETKQGTMEGHPFVIVAAEGNRDVHGLRLLDKSPGIEKINKKLFENFLSELDIAIDCISYGRQERGVNDQYEYNYDAKLIAWNTRFAVIESSQGGYCGGAHPYGDHRVVTYKTDSGEVEDVFDWLPDSYGDEIFQDSELGKLLVKIYRSMRSRIGSGENDANECLENLTISGTSIWPTDTGIVFQTWAPYALSSCMEDITVPYKDILPFLSPYGHQQIKYFMGK